MEGKRSASRWWVLVACAWAPVLGAACWGGEAPRVVDRVAGSAAAHRAVRIEPAARRLSGAVLTDVDLAAIASPGRKAAGPSAVAVSPPEPGVALPDPAAFPDARSTSLADAPLPPELVGALQSRRHHGPIDASHELAISFEDSSAFVLESALEGPSVLDEPLPPAAPAADLY